MGVVERDTVFGVDESGERPPITARLRSLYRVSGKV